jgi:hypothetical protein
VLVRTPEPSLQTAQREKLVTAIGKGLRFVLRQPVLRALAATAATGNFFASMIAAVYVLYAVRSWDCRRHSSAPFPPSVALGVLQVRSSPAHLSNASVSGERWWAWLF